MPVPRRSLSALAPWWPVAWMATSTALVAALLQIESGWFLAASYIGLNACALVYMLLGASSWRDRSMTIVGWCAAAQLPVMLWVVGSGRGARERLYETSGQRRQK